MKTFVKWILPLAVISIVSCNTQRVTVDYLRGTDFSQIRDYQFYIDQTTVNPFSIQHLESAIKNELAKRGVLENADSKIHIRISPKEGFSKQQSSSLSFGTGSWGRGFGTNVGVSVPIYNQYLNQHDVVGIYDENNQLIWQGNIDIQMPARVTQEEVALRIQKAVAKLFKNYPPRN